ncbi:diiron oxygenase [Streptomyces sp. NPDC101110]|uniref:diiron oxygenase n=1 Tax=unclassified Streptomyces TaxID=2593676 RepID=UPI00381D3FEC
MCGIVGLFVGCSALAYCPRKALAPAGAATAAGSAPVADAEPVAGSGRLAGDGPASGPAPEAGADGAQADLSYSSPFARWAERATVRRSPRRELSAPSSDASRYFSPELVPVARHPLIAELRPELFDTVLVQHLYRYLDFTAKLETLVVNRTALGIAQGSVGVELPEEMRFDAYKIYCDEAYHALFSVDLMRQVRDTTGIAPVLPEQPYFLRRLEEIQQELPPHTRALAELLFVTVSETLISASLAELPVDSEIVPAVRETIRDHAADEGRHHVYFAAFLRYLWAALDPAARREAALLVPRLIAAFLQPDLDAVRAELLGYGLTRDDAEQVLAEVYDAKTVAAHTRATAKRTISYFVALDVLDDPMVEHEFRAHGLL